ncbi:MAG: winged helix-turn-helix domain-containing protein [Thermoplasmata archaeon]|nr:MAG: winged helix-turn-helix domain-containing protein [Thermoplasmata archaeon]
MFISLYTIPVVMGQQEVYDFLKVHPTEWFTSKEISQEINISIGSVTVCLKKLRKNNEVQYKPVEKKGGKRTQYSYRFKP